MFILWHGLGWLAVVFLGGFYALLQAVLPGRSGDMIAALSYICSSVPCWFVGRYLRDNYMTNVKDKETGERVRVRQPYHALFFIPMHFWAPICLAFGGFLLVDTLRISAGGSESHTNSLSAKVIPFSEIVEVIPFSEIVFFGLPAIKYEVSVDESRRTKLTMADATKNAVGIIKIGDDYIWKTRENRKLIYSYPGYGDFHYFIDPQGGGYVKIARTPAGKVTFFEHVGIGMVTITYFGSAQSFTP